jgi:hypothetical protein
LVPGLNYVYTPNPAIPSGRRNALVPQNGTPHLT